MSREITVGPLAQFPDGQLVATKAEGHAVIVARTGDTVCVAANKCPHLGLSLTKGPAGPKYADGVVQCAWHNSRFEVCSGANKDWVTGLAGRNIPAWSRKMIALGKKPKDLTTYPARVADGNVVITVD
jgi:nitrite reductase/ring-hydroxylating ferredoxin subunit